jgi:hypothetical protein
MRRRRTLTGQLYRLARLSAMGAVAVLLLASTTTAFGAPLTLVSPANGTSVEQGSYVEFVAQDPSLRPLDTISFEMSSSSATNADGTLANPDVDQGSSIFSASPSPTQRSYKSYLPASIARTIYWVTYRTECSLPPEGWEKCVTVASPVSTLTITLPPEVLAQEVAEHAPVTFLRVKTVGHPDLNSSEAGHTTITVATNRYAHVTIIVSYHAGTFHYRAPGKSGAEIRWSCGHPGLRYSYVVTAVGGSGALLRRSGHFKMASAAWCAAERKKEKQEAEERRHKEQSPKGKIEHAEDEYCEKVLGGIPDGHVTVADHIYTHCLLKAGVVVVVSE